MNRRYFFGIICCLTAVLSWGGMFPIMGSALTVVNPFLFTAVRYTAAAALFLGCLFFAEGRQAFRLDGRGAALWLLGSLGFAGFGFFVFLGQQMAGKSGAVSASVMMALMPLLSVLINWLFRGIRPLRYSLGFVLMSFVGVLFVVTRGDFGSLLLLRENVLADVLMLLGALCWVVYTIGAAAVPGWSPLRYTALTTALGVSTVWAVNVALGLLGHNRVPDLGALVSIWPQFAYMIGIAGFVGVLSWNSGNRILTPINGVLFMDVVPLTTIAIAALQGYLFSRAELFGAGLTIVALVLNNVYQRAAGARPAAANNWHPPRRLRHYFAGRRRAPRQTPETVPCQSSRPAR
jgi:drug/metabolite transporter (DMT)-like permease